MIEEIEKTTEEKQYPMIEEIEKVPFIIPEKVYRYFSGTMDSKLKSDTGKFILNYLAENPIKMDYIDTPENADVLLHHLRAYRATKKEPEKALEFVRASGLLQEPPKEKKIKEVIIPEHIPVRTEESTLNIAEVEDTYLTKDKIEANIHEVDTREANPLSNKWRVEKLYRKIETHDTESWEYYQEFVDAGIVRLEEAQKDYEAVQKIEKKHQDNDDALEGKDRERNERNKKSSAITERGAEYAISELQWYGSTKMKKAPNYMDKLGATDSLFEISKKNQESDFIGIATDVTFNNLESDAFKAKVFKLLKLIRSGKNTSYKYGKNNEGEPMKEFTIPRTLLHFELKDARVLFEIIEKAMDPSVDKEALKDEYQSCPQKTNFMQQIFYSCKILSKYAQENENPIFRKYDAMQNAIKELSWVVPEIKEMIKNYQENIVGQRLEELVEEYRPIQDKVYDL